MNKKIIALIVAVIIILIAGVSIYFVTSSQDTASPETNNNETSNIEENNEPAEAQSSNETDSPKTENANILVLYFSMSGNTETVANMIHNEVGGDIVKLETVKTYPEDYNELVDYAQEEQQENARPELRTVIENIDMYDTIFLGYPNWWGDMPMPIYTFLDTYDLSGKTIAPFITHGGSGLSKTPENIRKEEPGATVTEGLAIYGSRASSSQSEVTAWLNSLGY